MKILLGQTYVFAWMDRELTGKVVGVRKRRIAGSSHLENGHVEFKLPSGSTLSVPVEDVVRRIDLNNEPPDEVRERRDRGAP